MRKVITYGTYDLFHEGHYKLLKRAKELGDYLIVGVTTENYDDTRGKMNVKQNLMERIENVKLSGLADQIIIEEYEGQKINDIVKYGVDVFAIGSDWLGKFDYLKEYCNVIYLDRTKGISSTQLRNESRGIVKLGIVGYGRIANRFVKESKFVSGVNVEGVFGRNEEGLKKFHKIHELEFYTKDYSELLEKVDAVYIASPHKTHYQYIVQALDSGKHVLCEKPMVLSEEQAKVLYNLANTNGCVLLEAIKTAYAPGFIRLISIAKSGVIGDIKNIDATFTKLLPNIIESNIRELDKDEAGGSVTELASYPILAIIKLLGKDFKDMEIYSYYDEIKQVDLFTKINFIYNNAVATAKIGLGVKSEGDLIISGTKGYIYVPAPWWKTEYFETRFEDTNLNNKYFYKFKDDGLRYEIAEFIGMINEGTRESYKLKQVESITISKIIESFLDNKKVKRI